MFILCLLALFFSFISYAINFVYNSSCKITLFYGLFFENEKNICKCVKLSVFSGCQIEQNSLERYATRLSGGGWAEPKNGEAYFWAWSWRCGVSVANTAEANFL